MKFKIEKNILENIISMVQPFLEKKDNSTITSHILLKIIESKLLIRSTDYEISLEIKNINVED